MLCCLSSVWREEVFFHDTTYMYSLYVSVAVTGHFPANTTTVWKTTTTKKLLKTNGINIWIQKLQLHQFPQKDQTFPKYHISGSRNINHDTRSRCCCDVCVTEKERGSNGKGIPFVVCDRGPYVPPPHISSIAYLSGLNQARAFKPFKWQCPSLHNTVAKKHLQCKHTANQIHGSGCNVDTRWKVFSS